MERVAVEVERVFPRVVIVEDDFDDFVVCEDELIRVCTVDEGVSGVGASGEDGVEGGDFRGGVGLVVEEGAGRCERWNGGNMGMNVLVCAVVEVVHFHVELDLVVDVGVEVLFIVRDELEVVEGVEGFEFFGGGVFVCVVVD